MSLTSIMLDQLAAARRIVEDRNEVVPAWRIATPEATYLVFTRFDHDKPEERARVLLLISRFMTWKLATSFVLTAETWLGAEKTRIGQEALLVVGVSRRERFGLIQRITHKPTLSFGSVQWLMPDQLDEAYFRLLPSGIDEMTVEEIAELSAIFGEDGEMAAERLS